MLALLSTPSHLASARAVAGDVVAMDFAIGRAYKDEVPVVGEGDHLLFQADASIHHTEGIVWHSEWVGSHRQQMHFNTRREEKQKGVANRRGFSIEIMREAPFLSQEKVK